VCVCVCVCVCLKAVTVSALYGKSLLEKGCGRTRRKSELKERGKAGLHDYPIHYFMIYQKAEQN
jgi:hypothetical protein